MVVEIERVELSGMDVKRFQNNGDRSLGVRIDQNSVITRMQHLDDDRGVLSFRFSIDYSSLGYIHIEGDMFFRQGAHDLIDRWLADGRIDVTNASLIHNAAVSSCLTTALILSREVKLPPPFPLPRVSLQQPPPPSSGVEVA